MIKTARLASAPNQIVKRAGASNGIGRCLGVECYTFMNCVGAEIPFNPCLREPVDRVLAATPVFEPLEVLVEAMADRIVPLPDDYLAARPGKDDRAGQAGNPGPRDDHRWVFHGRSLVYDTGWSAGGHGRDPSPLNIIQTR